MKEPYSNPLPGLFTPGLNSTSSGPYYIYFIPSFSKDKVVACYLPVLVPGDGETAMHVTLPLSLEASNPTGKEQQATL